VETLAQYFVGPEIP